MQSRLHQSVRRARSSANEFGWSGLETEGMRAIGSTLLYPVDQAFGAHLLILPPSSTYLGREYFRIVARSKRGVETAATTNSTHSLRDRVSVGVGCAPVSSKVPDICKKSLARLPCLFDLPYMRCNCQPSLLRGCLDRVDSGGARDFAGN